MTQTQNVKAWQGILLAAGKGKRFDASGNLNKLMQLLPSGKTVAGTSASNLCLVLPATIAVISDARNSLAALLELAGCEITFCPDAQNGLANSLVHALQHSPDDCPGWIIALADMPFVQPASIVAIVQALNNGAGIAVPTFQGMRGNPVGFSSRYLPQLLALTGDQGARSLLKTFPVTEVAVDDMGILKDIDVPHDLFPVSDEGKNS
jgi:molybdenum cofactor cytidylyltransferase